MAVAGHRASLLVGSLLVVVALVIVDWMRPAPLAWRLVPVAYNVASRLRNSAALPVGAPAPPFQCAGRVPSDGEGLLPRLIRHPHTLPGYWARKVGGVLPPRPEACDAVSPGAPNPICSNSSSSAGGEVGSDSSGRSIQKAPQPTAQHGTSHSSSRPDPYLYISYIADGGMANQAISHWNAMAAAVALGAKGLIMPPARVRTNWTEALETRWVAAPVDGVWDIASFHKYAAGKGIEVVMSPCSVEHYKIKDRYALQDGNFFGFYQSEVVNVPGLALKLWTPKQFAAGLKRELAKLLGHVTMRPPEASVSEIDNSSSQSVQGQAVPPQRLLLSMMSTLFMLKTRRDPVLTEVAMNLRFAPHLHDIAKRITAEILRQTGSRVFNGMHLRVEKDAAGWYSRDKRGGPKKAWNHYLNATREAGFNASTPLFVASGIMTNMTALQRKKLARFNGTVASDIIHRTPFLTADEVATLHMTQLAVIDFLVLANAQRLVTFDPSTFSSYLVEHRLLHLGVPRDTATCVFGLCKKVPDPKARVIANGILFDTFKKAAEAGPAANSTT